MPRPNVWDIVSSRHTKTSDLWLGSVESILALAYKRFRPGAKLKISNFRISNDHSHCIKVWNYQFDLQSVKRSVCGGKAVDMYNLKHPIFYCEEMLRLLSVDDRRFLIGLAIQGLDNLLSETYAKDEIAKECLHQIKLVLNILVENMSKDADQEPAPPRVPVLSAGDSCTSQESGDSDNNRRDADASDCTSGGESGELFDLFGGNSDDSDNTQDSEDEKRIRARQVKSRKAKPKPDKKVNGTEGQARDKDNEKAKTKAKDITRTKDNDLARTKAKDLARTKDTRSKAKPDHRKGNADTSISKRRAAVNDGVSPVLEAQRATLRITRNYMQNPLTIRNRELWKGRQYEFRKICGLFRKAEEKVNVGKEAEEFLSEIKCILEPINEKMIEFYRDIIEGK